MILRIEKVGGSARHAGRPFGVVCLKDASSALIPGRHTNDVAAKSVEGLRGGSRWKDQERYRQTAASQHKRNDRPFPSNNRIGPEKRRSQQPADKASATGARPALERYFVLSVAAKRLGFDASNPACFFWVSFPLLP